MNKAHFQTLRLKNQDGRNVGPTSLSLWKDPVYSKVTASLVVAITSLLIQLFFSKSPPTVASQDYSSQLQSLEKTKDAIQSLVTFIEQQKKQLQLSQSAVEALKAEQDRLHPLVEVDRKVINAMFAVQEERNQAAQSRERGIGVGPGVLASLIASTVYSIVLKVMERRKKRAP